MLLIDGVKYELWTPSNEDELEQMVREHAQDIFGEKSIYLDRKQRLKSLSGIGSIPDGYVITFGNIPHWHIVEVELSSHPLHDHIVSQVSRFISGISNPNIQRGIVNAIDEEIRRDDFLTLRLRKAIESAEIYRFLAGLISEPPILTIIIEKDTEELREALATLRYPQIKVVEFQTFIREGVGLPVHAHLFEPLYRPLVPTEPQPRPQLEISANSIEIELKPSYISYPYIGIKKDYKHLFPDFGEVFKIATNIGDIDIKSYSCGGSLELHSKELARWYKENRLKAGDWVVIKVIKHELMNEYYLDILRRGKESV